MTASENAENISILRAKMQDFINNEVIPRESVLHQDNPDAREAMDSLKARAKFLGLWSLGHPTDIGGGGLPLMEFALLNEIIGRSYFGMFAVGSVSMQDSIMLHLYGSNAQRAQWLEPLVNGDIYPSVGLTEPDVAGSDPTLMKTRAVLEGDEWVINGHKWFTSGAEGADFAIVIARTDPDAEIPQARNSAFIVPTKTPGFEIVRDVETMGGRHNHPEIKYTNVRVPKTHLLGERGGGHKLGQVRLGPARLAHCMRWLGQIEMALEMLIDRAQKRFAHGSYLSEKQSIQWMMSDSAMELYASKLMVLHAAYKIEQGMEFKQEVSMAKHHVANTLWRVIDRAMQVHGALGYSTDTPLAGMMQQARWARLADGADEVHQMRIAELLMRAYNEDGSVNQAVGGLPL